MNRWMVFVAAFILLVAIGCSSGGGNVVTPNTDLTLNAQSTGTPSQTHLWGYYDVYIDIPTQTATAVLNRDVMFAANVTQFVNKPPTNLNFSIIETPVTPNYIDVDIDVSIKHPFTGLTQYNGYDVRGIFMGGASGSLDYNGDLEYGVTGTDQSMLPDPDDTIGGPDGYTRWFNTPEFTIPGLFGYKPGVFASKAYTPSATLCPYKYFADGLGANDDLWDFLTTTTDDGMFSAGTTNTRNYYLRFPIPNPGIKYAYAIVANWIDETTHPANAPESVGLNATITDNVYYVDAGNKGGDLILDLEVFGWNYQPSTIFVESTVLSAVHEFDTTEMTPTGGTDTYSTYHTEIPADNVTSTGGNEFWVICEYGGFDYTNEFGVTNAADTDPLTAIFRYDLFVANEPYNQPPVCDLQVVTPMPASGWGSVSVVFDASGSSDPDPGDTLTYEWDFDGDDAYGEVPDDDYTGTAVNPTHAYTVTYAGDVNLKATDNLGAFSICTEPVNVTVVPSKNIALRSGVTPRDLGVDHGDGDLLILYSDGQVWKYLASGYYQSGTFFYDCASTLPMYIDVANNGDSIVGGGTPSVGFGRSFSASASPLSLLPEYYGRVYGAVGAITTSNATYGTPGYMSIITSGAYLGLPTYWWINRMAPPNYNAGGGNLYTNNNGAGAQNIVNMKGYCYSNNTMDRCWFLEGSPEFRLEAWNTTMGYAGQQVGGTQSDGMTGFNDPKDVTSDNSNNVYVLDLLSSGAPLVKKYSSSLNAVGSFGNTTTISGTPLKVEGSNFNGNIMVLHTNGLSIFLPSEMP